MILVSSHTLILLTIDFLVKPFLLLCNFDETTIIIITFIFDFILKLLYIQTLLSLNILIISVIDFLLDRHQMQHIDILFIELYEILALLLLLFTINGLKPFDIFIRIFRLETIEYILIMLIIFVFHLILFVLVFIFILINLLFRLLSKLQYCENIEHL